MKKLTLFLSAVLILSLIAGCTAVPPATQPTETTAPVTTTPSTTAPPETTVPTTDPSTTAADIAAIRELIEQDHSWYARALGFSYMDAEYLDVAEFFSCGFPNESREPTEEEWALLKDLPGFDPSKKLIRLPAEKANAVLDACFGITIPYTSGGHNVKMVYLESTNCYYFMVDEVQPFPEIKNLSITRAEPDGYTYRLDFLYNGEELTREVICRYGRTIVLGNTNAYLIQQQIWNRELLPPAEYNWTVYRYDMPSNTEARPYYSAITSTQELQAFWERCPGLMLHTQGADPLSIETVTAQYDDDFFKDHVLVVITCNGQKDTPPTISRIDTHIGSKLPYLAYLDGTSIWSVQPEPYLFFLTLPADSWDYEWNSYSGQQLDTTSLHLGVYWRHYTAFLPDGSLCLPLTTDVGNITDYSVKTCYTAQLHEAAMGRQSPVDAGVYFSWEQLESKGYSDLYDKNSTTDALPKSYVQLIEEYGESYFDDKILVDVFIQTKNPRIPTIERLDITEGRLRIYYSYDPTDETEGPYAYFYHLLIELPKHYLDRFIGTECWDITYAIDYIPK